MIPAARIAIAAAVPLATALLLIGLERAGLRRWLAGAPGLSEEGRATLLRGSAATGRRVAIAAVLLAAVAGFAAALGEDPSGPPVPYRMGALELPEVLDVQGTVIETGRLPFGLRLHPNGKHLYVANEGSNFLTLIDPYSPGQTGRLVLHNEDGTPASHGSHDLVFTQDGERMFVTNTKGEGLVAEVRLSDGKVLRRIAEQDGKRLFVHPDALAISSDDHWLVATDWKGSLLAIIDAKDPTKPVRTVGEDPEGGYFMSRPSGVVIEPSNRYAFVCMTESIIDPDKNIREGVVLVVDLESAKVHKQIGGLPRGAGDLQLSPDGKKIYTANWRHVSVSVIDVETQTKMPENIDLRLGSPTALAITADGKYAFVGNLLHPYVHVLDLVEGRLIRIIRVPDGTIGNDSFGIAVSPDGRTVFVSTSPLDHVVAIDVSWLYRGKGKS